MVFEFDSRSGESMVFPRAQMVAATEGILTDNGNPILDVHNLKITDPVSLESAMNQIAGVVTVGLFARRRADVLIVAGDSGVRTLDLP